MLPFSKCGSKQIVAFSSRSQRTHTYIQIYIKHTYICFFGICRNTVIDSVFTRRKAKTTRNSEVFEVDAAENTTMYFSVFMLCEAETIANSDVFEFAVAQNTAIYNAFLNLLSNSTANCDVFNDMVAKNTAICEVVYIFAQRRQASAMYKNTTKTKVSANKNVKNRHPNSSIWPPASRQDTWKKTSKTDSRRPAVKEHKVFSPDSESYGFLLQITMNCPCAFSRQVAGAGCRCWCSGAGVVSWLCTRWRQFAGADGGCRVGCRELAGGDRLLAPVLVLGAGCWCWCCWLAVHVVETGCWCWCWCWVPRMRVLVLVLLSWLCAWWRQVAGAGCRAGCVLVLGDGCRCARAGAVRVLVLSWLCTRWRQVAGADAGAGCRMLCCARAVRLAYRKWSKDI